MICIKECTFKRVLIRDIGLGDNRSAVLNDINEFLAVNSVLTLNISIDLNNHLEQSSSKYKIISLRG